MQYHTLVVKQLVVKKAAQTDGESNESAEEVKELQSLTRGVKELVT